MNERGAREQGNPKFSVIITTLNRPEFLQAAVESVLDQRSVSLECIIVDDGSETPSLGWDDPRVKVVRHEYPAGPGAARNSGLRFAAGQYVAFLDDDDLYTPTRLSSVEKYLSPATAVLCWSRAVRGSGVSGRLLFGDEFHSILDDSTPQIGTVTLARGSCPLFDESLELNEDVEWWLRVSECLNLFTVPYCLHRFREHAGVRVTDQARKRVYFSQVIMDKHQAYFDAHRRARAFRLRRMALIGIGAGDFSTGLKCSLLSFQAFPSAKASAHIIRTAVLAGRALGSALAQRVLCHVRGLSGLCRIGAARRSGRPTG